MLQQPGARAPGYAEQVDDILALLAGTYRTDDGLDIHAVPGEGADLQVWILDSGGQSATVAGERGRPFGADYHVSPSSVLESVEAYRDRYWPSDAYPEPYVIVSADVVVAADEDEAHSLAAPYAHWVYSIRSGNGAIPFPRPPRRRRARSRGRARTTRSSSTGSPPSSSAHRRPWPRSCGPCSESPTPTSCSSPPSPTTTPTDRTSFSPRRGSRSRPGQPLRYRGVIREG